MDRTGSTSRPFRFIGRERELERIRARLDGAVEGRGGGLVMIGGAPGVGVTTLAREAAARASAAGWVVAWGQCRPGTFGRPLGELADALESLASQWPPEMAQADLGSDAGPIIRLCPALSPLVPTLAPVVPLDPADERLRLYEAIVSWLTRVAMRRPLLLVIDDAEDAGDDLVVLLSHVVPRLRDTPLVLLVCGADAALRRVAVDAINVATPDEGTIAAILEDAGAESATAEVARLVSTVSGRNPLFALELFRHLRDEGHLSEPDRLPRPNSLPATLADVVAWRMAAVTGETRTAIEIAAGSPGGASASVVATAMGVSRSRASLLLETGVDTGLISADTNEGMYLVGQPQLRATILGRLDSDDLARLHRRLATAVEDEHRDRLRERAGELAGHYAASMSLDGRERGMNFVLLAAEQARAAYAHHRVVDCLAIALSLAPERDRALRADLLGRLAVAQAAAGLPREAVATAKVLVESVPVGAQVPADVYAGATDTIRGLRGTGVDEKALAPIEDLRAATLVRAARADDLVRARLDLLGERWTAVRVGGIATLVWDGLQPDAARALLAAGADIDGAEVMLPQRARTQTETARAAEFARSWRRPQSTLRAMRCLATDLVWRHGLFSEGAAWAQEYEATARRFGAHRDRVAALLLLARARAALGEFAAAGDAIAMANQAVIPLDDQAEFADELALARLAVSHYTDADWPDAVVKPEPAAASLLLSAQEAMAAVRQGRESDARGVLSSLLDACAHQPPLTLYRDAALVTALAAAWELGGAEHAAVGRSLIDLAGEGGAGGQIEGNLQHSRARMLTLSGDVPAARAAFADERIALDRSGLRPLRAIVDHDEAVAIAAAGKHGYVEATRLLELASIQFELLGMAGWLRRTRALVSRGLDVAAAPGGRLAFTYPRGLSRREIDVVRLVASGSTNSEAAAALVVEPVVFERLLASAMEKLGAERPEELAKLARRYGLGGA